MQQANASSKLAPVQQIADRTHARLPQIYALSVVLKFRAQKVTTVMNLVENASKKNLSAFQMTNAPTLQRYHIA
jgi:hypothetical protein